MYENHRLRIKQAPNGLEAFFKLVFAGYLPLIGEYFGLPQTG